MAKSMYAHVLVFQPIRLRKSLLLDYEVPTPMQRHVRRGVLVVVPLRNRLLPGMVIAVSDTSSVPGARAIHSVLDPTPVLSEQMLKLAEWMAREFMAPFHRCVQAMLPPEMRPRAYLRLTPLVMQVPSGLEDAEASLLHLLITQGPQTDAQVRRKLRQVDVRHVRHVLQQKGYIRVERLLRLPRTRPKLVPLVRLVAPREQWAQGLTKLRRTELYTEVLEFLEREAKPVEMTVVRAETGAEPSHLKRLEERGLIAFGHQEVMRDPLGDLVYVPDRPPVLTPGQAEVWEVLESMLRSQQPPPPVLLLGVTGSGKTELYMRAVAEVLRRGRQALILVPEISLTPQTVHRFAVRFPGLVGVWHSGMTVGERYDTWRRIRKGELSVVVGARSALFAPFPSLGLIVMDEEGDASYKQPQLPYYHAREVAHRLAGMAGALFIMGSATPSLEAYMRAREGRYRLLRLPARILGHRRRLSDWQRLMHLRQVRYQPLSLEDRRAPVQADLAAATIPLPEVQVVDMRAELKEGNRSIFSRALQTLVDQALSRHEQVILFLNRRGSATYVFCRDCGWVATCPRCDIPLTLHRQAGRLICHRCGYRIRQPRRCPNCGSSRVRAFGLGTEGLEARVLERWPEAHTVRWDRDVAHTHTAHTLIMGRFARGDADILVGTQMIARGIDLPKVTVVGVISADTALNLPDFRAAERTFQLLAQVAGRAGRGVLGGRVVVQTYHPDHYAIRMAAMHDYEAFAEHELAFRRRALYPPAIRMARLVFTHRDRHAAQEAAQRLAARLRYRLKEVGRPVEDLIGPAPAFFMRVRGRYRWHILVRHPAPADFLRTVQIPAGWSVDIDPLDVL